ncbi:MAG: hypothetical protein LBK53_09275 [Heliobacteriaceae bacterium]|jgi:hypothetical protein|nr:hypothetical protein [Heliobacteriaceae bacterium]
MKKEISNLTLWGYITPYRSEFKLKYMLPTWVEIKQFFKRGKKKDEK